MLTSIVSMVPRTLYHILTTPDSAVSWKWLVELPTAPTPIKGNGLEGSSDASAENPSNSFFDSAINAVTSIANTVTDLVDSTVGSIVGTIPLMIRAESVQVPHETISTTTTRTQARNRAFADSSTVNDMEITFYEDVNFTALAYLQQWQRAIVNEYGVFQCPEDGDPSKGQYGYSKEIKVHVFDTVGLKKGVLVLEGCFPLQISPYEFGSETGVIKTSCTFSVQRSRWEPGIFNSGSALGTAQATLGNITNGAFSSGIL